MYTWTRGYDNLNGIITIIVRESSLSRLYRRLNKTREKFATYCRTVLIAPCVNMHGMLPATRTYSQNKPAGHVESMGNEKKNGLRQQQAQTNSII